MLINNAFISNTECTFLSKGSYKKFKIEDLYFIMDFELLQLTLYLKVVICHAGSTAVSLEFLSSHKLG